MINERYELCERVGAGSFGTVYRGRDTVTNEYFGIKIEKPNMKFSQLRIEARILKILEHEPGFPTVHWFGNHNGQNVLVLDLLGFSLEHYLRLYKPFSLKTTIMIAEQILDRIEWFHNYGFIHRDIKPENLMTGIGTKNRLVHMIDFGLSKPYRDRKTLLHIPYKDGKKLTGTARYTSMNTHAGIEQSRRDDIEALFYVIIYFLRGSLPWQGINCETKSAKYRAIYSLKWKHDVENLCKGLPSEISTIATYARSVKFESTPDYGYIKELLQTVAAHASFTFDYDYDWFSSEEQPRVPQRKNISVKVSADPDKIQLVRKFAEISKAKFPGQLKSKKSEEGTENHDFPIVTPEVRAKVAHIKTTFQEKDKNCRLF